MKTSKCGLPCITETTTVSEMIVSNDESPGLVLNLINRIVRNIFFRNYEIIMVDLLLTD